MNSDRKTARVLDAAGDSLTATVGKNTFYGIIASLFQVGTRLVTVPIIIYHLGLGGYGIWSIIMTAAIYMRFGSAGVKSAFQKYVAEATGNGDYEKASQLLSTGTATMAALSVAGLIPVVIFSRQLAQAAGVPPEFLQDAAWAFSVLGLTMVFSNGGAAYEAIVLGGQRIDVARKINTVLTVAEAVAIIALLHIGRGLFAMACVMAASELIYLVCCYAVAHRVVPEVQVRVKHITRSVVRELMRFAGSYQLLNILYITYGAIVPIVLLRAYGADAAGVYAVASRLAGPVSMCHNAFLLPILSGGAMVYASGQTDRLQRLLTKSFKVTLALTLMPLALISIFGTYMVQAWTGRTDASFHFAIWLVCLALFFQSFSILALVLYRAAGGAVMDNVFQAIRLAAFVPVLFMAHRIGFEGILGWMAGSEFVGMILMVLVLEKSFHAFRVKMLASDALRLSVATGAIVAFAALAVYAVPNGISGDRILAIIKVGVVCLAALVATYPALYLTGSISGAEVRSIRNIFRRSPGTALPSVQ
ncbi:MAG: lipopolysaccharide biosynthesis protein [Candidatus Acidiferrales bacterium]